MYKTLSKNKKTSEKLPASAGARFLPSTEFWTIRVIIPTWGHDPSVLIFFRQPYLTIPSETSAIGIELPNVTFRQLAMEDVRLHFSPTCYGRYIQVNDTSQSYTSSVDATKIFPSGVAVAHTAKNLSVRKDGARGIASRLLGKDRLEDILLDLCQTLSVIQIQCTASRSPSRLD